MALNISIYANWERFLSPAPRLLDKSGSAFGFGLVRIFLRWPFRQEAVGIIAVLPGSIVRIPYVRKMDDRTRRGDGLKRLHRIAHNPALEFRLMGFAGLMSERKIEKDRARRINRLRNIERRGHA
jgi:hypothetical protein